MLLVPSLPVIIERKYHLFYLTFLFLAIFKKKKNPESIFPCILAISS